LIGRLRPLIFSVNIKRCLLFLAIFIHLLISFTYSLFTGILAQKVLFFIKFSCLILLSFSTCKSPLSIFCSAGWVVVNSFSFYLLWKVLLSPSIKNNFAGWTI
jgi:hypothetical protein